MICPHCDQYFVFGENCYNKRCPKYYPRNETTQSETSPNSGNASHQSEGKGTGQQPLPNPGLSGKMLRRNRNITPSYHNQTSAIANPTRQLQFQNLAGSGQFLPESVQQHNYFNNARIIATNQTEGIAPTMQQQEIVNQGQDRNFHLQSMGMPTIGPVNNIDNIVAQTQISRPLQEPVAAASTANNSYTTHMQYPNHAGCGQNPPPESEQQYYDFNNAQTNASSRIERNVQQSSSGSQEWARRQQANESQGTHQGQDVNSQIAPPLQLPGALASFAADCSFSGSSNNSWNQNSVNITKSQPSRQIVSEIKCPKCVKFRYLGISCTYCSRNETRNEQSSNSSAASHDSEGKETGQQPSAAQELQEKILASSGTVAPLQAPQASAVGGNPTAGQFVFPNLAGNGQNPLLGSAQSIATNQLEGLAQRIFDNSVKMMQKMANVEKSTNHGQDRNFHLQRTKMSALGTAHTFDKVAPPRRVPAAAVSTANNSIPGPSNQNSIGEIAPSIPASAHGGYLTGKPLFYMLAGQHSQMSGNAQQHFNNATNQMEGNVQQNFVGYSVEALQQSTFNQLTYEAPVGAMKQAPIRPRPQYPGQKRCIQPMQMPSIGPVQNCENVAQNQVAPVAAASTANNSVPGSSSTSSNNISKVLPECKKESNDQKKTIMKL